MEYNTDELIAHKEAADKRIDELLADNTRLVEEARAFKRETEAAKLQVSMMSVGIATTFGFLAKEITEMTARGDIKPEAAEGLLEGIKDAMEFNPYRG